MTDADASAAPEASEAPTATPPSRRSPWIRYAVSLATALALAAALAAIPRDECGASLIAMTSHGRGATARLLIGSVADKVVRGATVPVLVRVPAHR